jgi:hypothetical protein
LAARVMAKCEGLRRWVLLACLLLAACLHLASRGRSSGVTAWEEARRPSPPLAPWCPGAGTTPGMEE